MSPPSSRGRVSPPPTSTPRPPRSNSLPAPRQPPPAPPLVNPSTGSPTLDCIADAINSAAAPFQNAPPPEQGAAGWVAQGLGGVLGIVGAPQQLIDNAFAGLTAPIAAMFPAMPAITLLGMHIGMLHTHTHPPSLIPPAPPIPLPSIGMLVGSGSMAVLGCGLPLARAGDIGISVTCGSLAPPFEVFTGSSNVFVGGARAARILDITKHCDPTAMGPFGIAMAAAGVAAGAAGAIATGAAAAAAQAAADAAVLALKLLCGKDPGLPPGIGALVGPPCPTVMIGGFPCPPIGDMAIGALMKGLKKLAAAAKKLRSSRRANGNCADGSHPIYLVTGENFDRFTDFVSPGLFRWDRYYSTALADFDGQLGFGFRHCYQRHLDVRLHRITFIDWDGVELEFPKFAPGINEQREHGYVLRRVAQSLTEARYELSTRGEPTMIFAGDRFTEVLPLIGLRSDERELTFEYDRNGWLVGVSDSARGSAEITRYQIVHDPRGRIVGITELGKDPIARFACTYTPAGELHQVRDACNGLWTYEYDPAHRWTRQTDPRGYAYSFRYDEQGRCVWASGQDGLWAAQVEYFPEQRLTRYTEGEAAVWEYHYDADGFITKIVNPEGGERVRVRSADGRILEDIDPGGRVLTFEYDSDGANTARVDRFGYVHPPEAVTSKLANPFAREIPQTALARSFAGCIEASPEAMLGTTGQLLEIPTELRQLARGVFRMRVLGGPPIASPIRQWFDGLGRPVYEIDGLNRSRRRGYDEAGNEIALLDRDGRLHRRETSSWNLLGARIDPLGNTTRYTYDRIEQMVGLTDPLGNVARWAYDRAHRLTHVWQDEQLVDVYEYNDGDHFIAKYDGNGELVFRNVEFHENHFVARRELASGGIHRFDYDAEGRVTEASTHTHEIHLSYDARDKRAKDVRDGRGLVRQTGRDRERVRVLERFEWICERLSDDSVRLTAPNCGTVNLRHSPDGIVLRECGNGTREWLQYDHEGRLEGRMTSRRTLRGSYLGWGVRYGHSPEGDLLSVADSVRGTTLYHVDDAHRLVGETLPSGERRHYEFDAADNLIRSDSVSRLSVAAGNRIDATATELFEHDRRDRVVVRRHRDGPLTRYHYDSFDMLEVIEIVEGGQNRTWCASYDAIGRRLWTEFEGRRREFFWDGDRLSAEFEPSGRLRIYLYAGHDALVPLAFVDYASGHADPRDGRLYHVFCDGAGMPLHVEDERAEIVWWASSVHPWGMIDIHPSAELEFNLRWPGHYFDPDTGLHYNRYRYYDPKLGRYLAPDPIGFRGSDINLYAYCTNPLVQVDVLGLTHRGKGDPPDSDSPTDVDGKRQAQRERIAAMQRARRRRTEQEEHARIVDRNRQARDNGEFDAKLSAADLAYINDERALSRASDPDKRLGDGSPGSTIDEARAMQHAENTGQLPAPVERSVRPGADVRTGTGDAEQHHSMKGISNHDHPRAMSRASGEIDKMAGERRRGSEPHGVVIDLRHSPDPAADRATLQTHADSVNQSLRADGHDPIPVNFIEPWADRRMSAKIDQADLELHQQWILDHREGKRQDRRDEVFNDLELLSANLINSRFSRCVFRRARLIAVECNGSIFDACRFEDCLFDGCVVQDTRFESASFVRTSFPDTGLQSCTFSECRFEDADLSTSDLTKAIFYNCQLTDSRFVEAKLKRSYFSECNLQSVEFTGAIAERSDFVDCDMRGAIIEGLQLDHTYFTRCGLAGIQGKPINPQSAILVAPDYSTAFDGSALVSPEQVVADWS